MPAGRISRRMGPTALACALLAAGPGVGAAPPAPPRAPAVVANEMAPPRLNLAVEWRWSEAALRRPAAAAAAAGPAAVVTSTAGSTAPPQGQLTVRAGPPATALASPALPTRLVLANGGLARVRLAEALPWQSVQAWQEPGGRGAVLVPGWVESVQALELRVRWPGGQSAAEVDIEVEQAVPPAADGSAPGARRERLATRAWVPLGEWVTVAAWGGAGAGSAAGASAVAPPGDATTVSTAALEARAARVLQLRLSVMP